MISLNTNLSSMHSARLLTQSSTALTKSLARLSSGSRIVSPEDDPGGLGQSMRLGAQINRVAAANTVVSNAVSFSQTQDGFLQTVQSKLDRMSELSVLAQDATKTNGDLSNYQAEFTALQAYISDVTNKTYNGVSMFAIYVSNLKVTVSRYGMGGYSSASISYQVRGMYLLDCFVVFPYFYIDIARYVGQAIRII